MQRWFMLALLLLPIGCVAPPTPYDRAAGVPVTSIGVLTPSMPDRPTIIDMGAATSFGLIGLAAERAVQSPREGRLVEAMAAQRYSARPRFAELLAAAVTAQGYRVTQIDTQRVKRGFLDSYKGLPASADAWLDCFSGDWGYHAAASGDATPYRPFFYLICRLVRASDGTVLMHDRVFYNWPYRSEAAKDIVTIAPEPRFVFVTSEELVADPALAIQGIDEAFRASAEAVGTILK